MDKEELTQDKAYKKGLDIILFKKNSKKQLREKLLNKGFPEDVTDEAIVRLEEAGYINDRKYAESYFRINSTDKYKTKYQMKQELTRKGIDSDVIEEVLNNYDEDVNKDVEKIKQFINNKYYNLLNDGNIEYNKLVSIKRSLYSKGFDPEYVDEVIESLRKEIRWK